MVSWLSIIVICAGTGSGYQVIRSYVALDEKKNMNSEAYLFHDVNLWIQLIETGYFLIANYTNYRKVNSWLIQLFCFFL